jgi:flagellar biosynthesis/type III secretory pathway protein FliH
MAILKGSNQKATDKETKNKHAPTIMVGNIIKADPTRIFPNNKKLVNNAPQLKIIKSNNAKISTTILLEKIKDVQEVIYPDNDQDSTSSSEDNTKTLPSYNNFKSETAPTNKPAAAPPQSQTLPSLPTTPPKPTADILPPTPAAPVIPNIPISTAILDPKLVQKEIDKVKTKAEVDLTAYKKQAQAKIDADLANYKKKIMANLENERQAAVDQAYQEGINLGRKEGASELAEQSAEILKTVNDAIAEKNKLLKKARGEVLRLAIKVAEQILKSEISLNQAVCVNIVAEAISRITDKDRVIIKVNKADVDFVKMNRDRFLNQMGDVKNLTIQEDSRVEQGGCIIETDLGYIDATIHTKLESIEKAIFKTFEEEQLEEARATE